MQYYDIDYYRPPNTVLQAIGRIAVICASIEDMLHVIHWRYVETSWDIAPILTGDIRPSRLMDDIVRIAVAANEEPARVADLKDLFADYRELSEQRNKCMHWLWYHPKQRRHILMPPSHREGRPPVSFTSKELNAVADDLVWIEARVRSHALDDEDFEKERKAFGWYARYAVPAPWLDRPPRKSPNRPPHPSAG
jgi:hypothetical protein